MSTADSEFFEDNFHKDLLKKENAHIYELGILFHDIPIIYETFTVLSIEYEIEFCNGDKIINIVKNEVTFVRRIEEAKGYHFIRNRETEGWNEISFEEWKKYL
jgi:hypothetical protein